jgi:hypothetical protein
MFGVSFTVAVGVRKIEAEIWDWDSPTRAWKNSGFVRGMGKRSAFLFP